MTDSKKVAQTSTAKTGAKVKRESKTLREEDETILPAQKKRKMTPDVPSIVDGEEAEGEEQEEQEEKPSYADMERNIYCE